MLGFEEEDLNDDGSRFVVDLAPYRVQDINKFYHRDHPVQLHPQTPAYRKYWLKELKHYVEGRWVLDSKGSGSKGTWYWVPPKLDFYINYLTLEDEKRNVINPTMRDIDRIIFRYITCMDGFSGFEGDDKYTCNDLVRKVEEDTATKIDKRKLTPSCYIPGTENLKKYINPWEYLRTHYLIDEPCEAPMGRALWENPLYNAMILAARFTGKSSSIFVGDFMHEWFFCGVKYFEDLPKVNRRYLFSMASADSAPLRRSISLISSNMSRLPGKYRFATDNGNRIPDYMGPMYKNFVGTWRPGSDVTHIEKDRGGRVAHTGAMCQMRILTPDKTSIVAGDRFRRIIVEEVGFLEKIMEIWANAKDSLRLGMNRVGSFIGLGTSGELVAFRQSYELFNNPDTYDIFALPDYWNNVNKKIGLFIPSYYTDRDYADENENQDIVEAFRAKMEYRKEQRETASSMAYDKEVMYHPVEPKEMMRPSGISVLPRQEAQEQLTKIETYNIYKNMSVVGDIVWDLKRSRGVDFKVDMNKELHPITTYSTTNYPNLKGAVTLYEQPISNPPKYLYYVLYDPAAQSGEGDSLHSILVYKNFYKGSEGGLEDTIVAEWLGRLETLEMNWTKVIQIAKFFNASILAETNTPGFIDWCKKENYFHLLQSENVALKKELNPKATATYYKKGFRMDKRQKGWALNMLKDWLLKVTITDANGVPVQRVIDTIYSPRILEEIVHYDLDGNYDHVSSLLGLMLLHNQLEGREEITVKDEFSNEDYFFTQADEYENVTPYTRMTRAAFVDY